MVRQRDRREQHREPVRCRDGAGNGKRRKIGADEIELILAEGEHGAVVDVGGIDGDERLAVAKEIGIGRAMKHQLIVDRAHLVVGAVCGIDHPLPSPGQQIDAPDVPANVGFQEVPLEIREEVVPIETVVGGGKAPAGYRGVAIEFVQKAAFATIHRS